MALWADRSFLRDVHDQTDVGPAPAQPVTLITLIPAVTGSGVPWTVTP